MTTSTLPSLVFVSLAFGCPSVVFSDTAAQPVEKCDLDSIYMPVPNGWQAFASPKPPKGKKGWSLARTDAGGAPLGIIRIKSVSKSLKKYKDDAYKKLAMDAVAELKKMNIKIGDPIWKDLHVPVTKESEFEDAMLFGHDGKIKGDKSKLAVWLFLVHRKSHYFVFTLISPNKDEHPEILAENKKAFMEILQGGVPKTSADSA